jgi:hypothetical protein
VEQLFVKHDANRNGLLEPLEVAAVFRYAMPSLDTQQLRYLLTHLHTVRAGNLHVMPVLTCNFSLGWDPSTSFRGKGSWELHVPQLEVAECICLAYACA